MKKILVLVCSILLSFSFSANAQFGNMISSSFSQNTQNAQDVKAAEKIKQLKNVYIAKELNLKSEEYNDFWQVYNKYEDALNQAWTENRNERDLFEVKRKQLQKEFRPGFQKALGSEQRADKVFIVESGFRKMLKNELRGRNN